MVPGRGRAMGREAASTMRRAVGSSTARARRTEAAKQVGRGAVKAANSVCSTDGREHLRTRRRGERGVDMAGRRRSTFFERRRQSEVYEEESAYG